MSELFADILGHHKINSGPKRCLVLDFDSTLGFTLDEEISRVARELFEKSKYDLSKASYNVKVREKEYFGIKRPNLDIFLEFCDNQFIVIVWSAGVKEYVHNAVKEVFKGHNKPYMIYTRDECEFDSDGNIIKPLEKLFNDPKNRYATSENTIIIDDTPSTFSMNEFNAIRISKFKVNQRKGTITLNELLKTDRDFLEIMWYLLSDQFLYCEDVKGLSKPVLT